MLLGGGRDKTRIPDVLLSIHWALYCHPLEGLFGDTPPKSKYRCFLGADQPSGSWTILVSNNLPRVRKELLQSGGIWISLDFHPRPSLSASSQILVSSHQRGRTHARKFYLGRDTQQRGCHGIQSGKQPLPLTEESTERPAESTTSLP